MVAMWTAEVAVMDMSDLVAEVVLMDMLFMMDTLLKGDFPCCAPCQSRPEKLPPPLWV